MSSMGGPFADFAHEYTEAGLVVIPCGNSDGKTPSITWGHLKHPLSGETIDHLVANHGTSNIGILTGPSNVTIVDVDDAEYVPEMLERCGETPIITGTPSGGVHLWYRSRGESTRTSVEGLPVDIRGIGGFAVTPPSVRPSDRKQYTWFLGSLLDLSDLPALRSGAFPTYATSSQAITTPDTRKVPEGRRNNELFKLLCPEATTIDTLETFQEVAHRLNAERMGPPLPKQEVLGVAASVWKYKEEGRLWTGSKGFARVSRDELGSFSHNPAALALLALLRINHGSRTKPFTVSPEGMERSNLLPGWGRKRYRFALNALVRQGALILVKQGGRAPGDPSLFSFPPSENRT